MVTGIDTSWWAGVVTGALIALAVSAAWRSRRRWLPADPPYRAPRPMQLIHVTRSHVTPRARIYDWQRAGDWR